MYLTRWHLTDLLFCYQSNNNSHYFCPPTLSQGVGTGHGRARASSTCLGSILTSRSLRCTRGSLLRYGSKGQILLCYFYEVKRRGSAQAGEKQSKTFITDIVMTQRETVPLHLNTKQALTKKNKNHTYPSPKTLTTPFPPEKIQWTETMSKKKKWKKIFVNRHSPWSFKTWSCCSHTTSSDSKPCTS